MPDSLTQPRFSTDGSDRSLGDLLRDLSNGTADLVRQEIQLARTETTETIHRATTSAVDVAVGAALGLACLGAITAGVILLISHFLLGDRTWLGSLIIGVLLGIVALVYVRRGIHALSPSKLVPDQTTSSLRETASWLKHPTTFVKTSS